MRVIRWLVWVGLVCGLTAGVVVGYMAYSHIPFGLYFWVPFGAVAAVLAGPFALILILLALPNWRARGIFAAVCVLLAAAAFLVPRVYRQALDRPGDQGPYLSWVGDPRTSMTVSWTTARPRPSVVMVRGAGDEAFRTILKESRTHFHHVMIEGLSAGAGYEYSVPDLEKGLFTFETAPDDDSAEFSFAVYGDNRPWSGISKHDDVFRAMHRYYDDRPYSFIINTGDVVENPGQGYGWQWRQFLDTITPLAAEIPYMVSLGNHEARGTTRFYEEYFAFANQQLWYAFSYGGVLFVMLSSEHDLAPGHEQYAWLEQTLAEEGPKHRLQVVSLHRPIITYDPRERYRDTIRRETLSPLFQRYGIDLVLSGHVHAYEHHVVDGYHHVITGGGGVLLWNKPELGPETVKTETTFHYCIVDVGKNDIQVTVYRLDGSVIEQFTVEPIEMEIVQARLRNAS